VPHQKPATSVLCTVCSRPFICLFTAHSCGRRTMPRASIELGSVPWARSAAERYIAAQSPSRSSTPMPALISLNAEPKSATVPRAPPTGKRSPSQFVLRRRFDGRPSASASTNQGLSSTAYSYVPLVPPGYFHSPAPPAQFRTADVYFTSQRGLSCAAGGFGAARGPRDRLASARRRERDAIRMTTKPRSRDRSPSPSCRITCGDQWQLFPLSRRKSSTLPPCNNL